VWRQSVGAGGLSGRTNELSNSVETKKVVYSIYNGSERRDIRVK
jgi:hypothetical protein